MSSETLNLTPQLYDYLIKVSLREPDVLRELRQKTHRLKNAAMQISPEQGQFMALLMALLGAQKTLDIGTFTGYSALVVALALPKEGKVIACDLSEEWTKIGRQYWEKAGVSHKIELRIAPALDTLQTLIENGEKNSFDFAFIDADKANYAAYYEKSLALIRQGGVIAIDNVLWGGSVADPSIQDVSTEAIRELNQTVFADERVDISMLPIGDGLTLVRKR